MKQLTRLFLFTMAQLGMFLTLANAVACQFGQLDFGTDSGCLVWADEIGIGVQPDRLQRITIDQCTIQFFTYGSNYGGNEFPSAMFPGIDYIDETWMGYAVRVHHCWVILAASLSYAAVRFIYRRQPPSMEVKPCDD